MAVIQPSAALARMPKTRWIVGMRGGLPVGDPATGIGMVSYGKFTAREKDLIAGGNLNRLLKGVR